MSTLIYRISKVEGDKVGNDFIVSQENLDCELAFDEVYSISEVTHTWVAAKSVADLENAQYEKVKNMSFRGLLSNMVLNTPVGIQPKTYFIEKEVDNV